MRATQTHYFIFMIVCALVITGCSLVFGQQKLDKERFAEQIEKWKRAETRTLETLDRSDEMDIYEFEDRYHKDLEEMHEAQEQFSNLIREAEEGELEKDARLARKGMIKIRMALWTYGSYVQLYLERKHLGDSHLAQQAKRKRNREFLGYKKSWQEGHSLIQDSGLLNGSND